MWIYQGMTRCEFIKEWQDVNLSVSDKMWIYINQCQDVNLSMSDKMWIY